MSKVTAIIKRRNLLRKCKEKHTTYVNIDVILMWLDNIKEELEDEIRILITDEENLSSVQIFIPLYVSDIFGKADALIYALFVDNNYRRKGVAKSLLQLAEQQAKLNGVKTIGLHFVEEESDRFVLDWYLRSGYKLFDKKSNLLIKKLEE